MNRNLITAALPYANGYSHLGHAAGAFMPSDMFARFKRLSGEETLYVCGSDEHGVPITISAKKEGVSPQQVVDKYHKIIGDSFKELGIRHSFTLESTFYGRDKTDDDPENIDLHMHIPDFKRVGGDLAR